ncbi:Nn.00g052250.m01.CDS01 [Neocucurbitaria sp. VM-36]
MADMEGGFLSEPNEHSNSSSAILHELSAFFDVNMEQSNISNRTEVESEHEIRATHNDETVKAKDRVGSGSPADTPAADIDRLHDDGTQETVQNYTAVRPVLYFNLPIPGFDPRSVNYDRIGILYQFMNQYFSICECLHYETNQPTICRAWVPKHLVGNYLFLEWESLPKVQVGRYGMGVSTSDGSWKVHSTTIQKLRRYCLVEAQDVEKEVFKLSIWKHVTVLEDIFGRVVDAYYTKEKAREDKAAKEADEVMKEFMKFDD